MDISKKKELSAMISSKIMSNRMSLDPKQKNNLLNREKQKRIEKKSQIHDIDHRSPTKGWYSFVYIL